MDRVEERWLANTRSARGRSKPRTNFGKRGRTVSRQLWGKPRVHGYARLSPYSSQFPKLHWNLFPAFDWGHFFTTGKGKALLAFVIIGLAINGVYFAVDSHSPGRQALDVLTGSHNFDPPNIFWRATSPGSDLSEFNSVRATYTTGISAHKAIQITANSTQSGVAISKIPIDISRAVGKQLLTSFTYSQTTNTATLNQFYGMYLTTNSTLPTQLHYNPKLDPSVAYIHLIYTTGASSWTEVEFEQRANGIGQSLGQQDIGGCVGSSSCHIIDGGDLGDPSTNRILAQNELNFTGNTGQSSCSGTSGGNGCSWTQTIRVDTTKAIGSSTQLPAWLNLQQRYYVGFIVQEGQIGTAVNFYFDIDDTCTIVSGTSDCMRLQQYSAVALSGGTTIVYGVQQTSGGDFWGSAFQFLVSSFIPGGSLLLSVFNSSGFGNILGNIGLSIEGAFVAALSVAINVIINALQVFETAAKSVMNLIGSAFGFPSTSTNCGVAGGTCALGDLVFLWMSNLITFLAGTFNTLLAQLGAIFTGIFNAFLVFVQWITQAFSWLSSMLTFAGNIAIFAFGIFTTALKFTTIFIPFWVFVFFLGFNADEGVPGWIQWYGFVKWVTFDLGVKWTLEVLNFSVDIVLFLVGLIPKPFIQMSIGKIPRLPILNIHGSFSWPSFNGQALKEGNLFSVLGMLGGFIGFVWYELSQTGIPGSLAAEYPTASFVTNASTAITFYKLFLPLAVLVVFLLMIPTLFTSIFGVRVEGIRGVPVNVRTGSFRTRTVSTGSQGPIFRSTKYATDSGGRPVIDQRTGEKILLRKVDRFLAKGARRQENIRFNESQERRENTLLSKRLDEEARKVAQEEKTRQQEQEKQRADTARDLEEQAE